MSTAREMRAGAAQSARYAAQPVRRPMPEKWDQTIERVFRPADGAGSQERMKLTPGSPGAIGHAKDLFTPIRGRG
jgi:hypothetical protein